MAPKNSEIEIKVKKSHHIGTEPLLNVIHDRGLRHGDLWSKATDKPKRPKTTENKNTPPTNKNTNNKITERKITTTEKCNSCHTKPTHTHTLLAHRAASHAVNNERTLKEILGVKRVNERRKREWL